jgi:hypothetical protein
MSISTTIRALIASPFCSLVRDIEPANYREYSIPADKVVILNHPVDGRVQITNIEVCPDGCIIHIVPNYASWTYGGVDARIEVDLFVQVSILNVPM